MRGGSLMATWTTKVDNVDNVAAADVNTLQTEKIDRDGQIPLTGVLQWDKGADVASANPLVLGKDGNYFDITGTAGIAAINQDMFGGTTAVQAGTVVKLHFDGACLLTHSANFYLPGAANYTTAAGDELEFTCFGSDTWRCTSISPAGAMDVVRGGTGAATLTDHGVLLGSGTAAVTPTAVGATGEYLAGATGADPAFATLNQAAVAGLTTADGPTFAHVHVTTANLAGSAMQSEAAGTVGVVSYATDAGREAVGGQALEVIVKSQNSATYHRAILDNRQDCVIMTEIIGYTA
jgi:hypothetical protein